MKSGPNSRVWRGVYLKYGNSKVTLAKGCILDVNIVAEAIYHKLTHTQREKEREGQPAATLMSTSQPPSYDTVL